MQRPFNFGAGPSTMPEAVLHQAAAEMLSWSDARGQACGMGVMEMSHRGKEFQSILEATQADLRTLLAIPPSSRYCSCKAVAWRKTPLFR